MAARDEDVYWPDPQRVVARDAVHLGLKSIADVIRERIPPPNPLVSVGLRTQHGGKVETVQVVVTISGDTIERVLVDALRGVQGEPVDLGDG